MRRHGPPGLQAHQSELLIGNLPLEPSLRSATTIIYSDCEQPSPMHDLANISG